MAEYIEREAVMQMFADHVKRSNNSDFAPTPTWNQAVQIVEDIPAADVVARDCYDRLLAENDELRKERPVVRCADCRYNITPDKLYAQCNFNYAIGPQDFFCKAGERKDGDEDV